MTRKIRAVIVDDEALARTNVREALRSFARWSIVDEAESGHEVVSAVEQHRPDVVFLDIQMPGQSGIEAARVISSFDDCPLVVFVTAFDRYAVEAFELCAFDYLLKPFDDERFLRLVGRVEHAIDTGVVGRLGDVVAHLRDPDLPLTRLLIRSVGTIKVIPVANVLWISGSGNYVEVHHRDGRDLHRIQLSSLERKLDDQAFCRVHRSAIVRLCEVRELRFRDGDVPVAVMSDGSEVRVSASYREVFLAALDR